MLPGTNFGTAYFTATATLKLITSANAYIIGLLFHGSATNSARLWSGTTATGSTQLSGVIYANPTAAATVNTPTYIPFPANAPGGITMEIIGSGDPNVTLFWNPSGGA